MTRKRIGASDIRNLSTRAGYQASHTSDIRSKSASAQSGSVRLESPGMLARLKRSVFGNGESRE